MKKIYVNICICNFIIKEFFYPNSNQNIFDSNSIFSGILKNSYFTNLYISFNALCCRKQFKENKS